MQGIIISMNTGPLEELAMITDQKILAVWALDCAEHVLPIFEEKYPNDPRPREAFEAGRAWVHGEIRVGEARKSAFFCTCGCTNRGGRSAGILRCPCRRSRRSDLAHVRSCDPCRGLRRKSSPPRSENQ